ncbi:hypothetical protein G6F23_014822 [Rhizopus arrhizus]|nr:hypothetical protein G6F23_014822 [Rhizopus arrhizus]
MPVPTRAVQQLRDRQRRGASLGRRGHLRHAAEGFAEELVLVLWVGHLHPPWQGSAITALTLWKSSHDRRPLSLRKVKKSLKIFLWVMTPVMIATSMNIAQKPPR